MSPILAKHYDDTIVYTIELRENGPSQDTPVYNPQRKCKALLSDLMLAHCVVLLGSSYFDVVSAVKEKIEEYVQSIRPYSSFYHYHSLFPSMIDTYESSE